MNQLARTFYFRAILKTGFKGFRIQFDVDSDDGEAQRLGYPPLPNTSTLFARTQMPGMHVAAQKMGKTNMMLNRAWLRWRSGVELHLLPILSPSYFLQKASEMQIIPLPFPGAERERLLSQPPLRAPSLLPSGKEVSSLSGGGHVVGASRDSRGLSSSWTSSSFVPLQQSKTSTQALLNSADEEQQMSSPLGGSKNASPSRTQGRTRQEPQQLPPDTATYKYIIAQQQLLELRRELAAGRDDMLEKIRKSMDPPGVDAVEASVADRLNAVREQEHWAMKNGLVVDNKEQSGVGVNNSHAMDLARARGRHVAVEEQLDGVDGVDGARTSGSSSKLRVKLDIQVEDGGRATSSSEEARRGGRGAGSRGAVEDGRRKLGRAQATGFAVEPIPPVLGKPVREGSVVKAAAVPARAEGNEAARLSMKRDPAGKLGGTRVGDPGSFRRDPQL